MFNNMLEIGLITFPKVKLDHKTLDSIDQMIDIFISEGEH
jgi:hypothetical protein